MANLQLSSTFRTLLNQFPASISGLDKNVIIATSMARAIASQLPLPTSPVQSIQQHYTANHTASVMELVSGFNEGYVIDIRLVMDLTFKFYNLRYSVCHESIDTPGILGCIATLSPDNFPPKVNDVLKRVCAASENDGQYARIWSDFVNECVISLKEYNTTTNPEPTPVV